MKDEAYQVDFYQHIRESIRSWLKVKGKGYKFAEYLLAAPDLFHLLTRVATDSEVPVGEKAQLIGAIVYFVSPFDFLPEALVSGLGYIDDVVVAALVLNRLVNKLNPDIIQRHWAGEQDVLALVQKILKAADELVGTGLWKRIKRRFGASE
jgi:uncharacterized membrane protein YkvA (DUF1232 family)